MKRSDMVKIGTKIIQQLRNSSWQNDEIASKMLEEFELAGMNPPIIMETNDHEEYPVSVWEDENEL